LSPLITAISWCWINQKRLPVRAPSACANLSASRKSAVRCYVDHCDVGRGIFAAEPLPAGALVLAFTGRLLTLREVRAKGALAANVLQIGINQYLDLEEPGRFVNHSCRPNAGVVNLTALVTLRPVRRAEEIRFDYSTTISDGWTMPCKCGMPECRGVVAAYQLLPPALRQRYALLGVVQPFMLDLVGA
jgi:hypothetical protein